MPNKRNLLAVKNRMLANRERFQYHYVFSYKLAGQLVETCELELCESFEFEQLKSCGTHCCVAGFANEERFCQELDLGYEPAYLANFEKARTYLDLPTESASFLFCPNKGESAEWTKLVDRLERLLAEDEELSVRQILQLAELRYLLKYPNLDAIDYTEDDDFDEAIARIDYLLASPE
jgi:hypothetical protein